MRAQVETITIVESNSANQGRDPMRAKCDSSDKTDPKSTIETFPPHVPPEELKPLLSHLKYAYLDDNQQLPVIIANNLHREGSPTNKATTTKTKSDQPRCSEEGGDEVTCCQGSSIPFQIVTGSVRYKCTKERVCIDYRKLNQATHKDHFPLPFIDRVLEKLAEKYMQIHITLEDQHKTTFTCPFGTFTYT
ncbi:hypothetical protein CR513_17075, partial [Mucuna pruriens]